MRFVYYIQCDISARLDLAGCWRWWWAWGGGCKKGLFDLTTALKSGPVTTCRYRKNKYKFRSSERFRKSCNHDFPARPYYT
jgi:hypothetical protein